MEFRIEDHRTLSSQRAFSGRIIEVFQEDVRLPDGRTVLWERVSHMGAVGMVPLMPDGRVLLVRQYRHAVGGVLLEIPAGKLDRDEPPQACARRELTEEVGYRAEEMLKLADFYNSPGYSNEYFYLYLARGLKREEAESEADEFLEVVSFPLETCLSLISKGEIEDAKTIIGVALTMSFLAGDYDGYRGEEKPRRPLRGNAISGEPQ